MPCRTYEPSEYRYDGAAVQNLKEEVNRLTRENDMLRESILKVIHALPEGKKVTLPQGVIAAIRDNQIKHRKEDLARLEKTFRKSRDAEKLGLVLLANPDEELEPQLGFNPDDF